MLLTRNVHRTLLTLCFISLLRAERPSVQVAARGDQHVTVKINILHSGVHTACVKSDFLTLSCLFWWTPLPPFVLHNKWCNPYRGLKRLRVSFQWRRINYFAEACKPPHRRFTNPQLNRTELGIRERKWVTLEDPCQSDMCDCIPLESIFWCSENVGVARLALARPAAEFIQCPIIWHQPA